MYSVTYCSLALLLLERQTASHPPFILLLKYIPKKYPFQNSKETTTYNTRLLYKNWENDKWSKIDAEVEENLVKKNACKMNSVENK